MLCRKETDVGPLHEDALISLLSESLDELFVLARHSLDRIENVAIIGQTHRRAIDRARLILAELDSVRLRPTKIEANDALHEGQYTSAHYKVAHAAVFAGETA